MGGAMLTGVREAVRALSLLRGDDARFGAAAAEDVATGPLVKRRAVRRAEDALAHWPSGAHVACCTAECVKSPLCSTCGARTKKHVCVIFSGSLDGDMELCGFRGERSGLCARGVPDVSCWC